MLQVNTEKNIILKPKEFLLKAKKLYIWNNICHRILQYYTAYLLRAVFEYTNPSTLIFWHSKNEKVIHDGILMK